MRIQTPPAGAIASAVWALATRTLTSLAGNYSAVSGRVTPAASAITDLRPTAGKYSFLSVTGLNSLSRAGLYDGTNFDATGTGGTTSGSWAGPGNSTRGLATQDQGSATLFAYAGWQIS